MCRNDLQIPKEADGYENVDVIGHVGATGATGPIGEPVIIIIIIHSFIRKIHLNTSII